MLRSLDDLRGYKIQATDGEIGKVERFFFDDEKWVVRYLVISTGGWLVRNEVLISPIAVKNIDWSTRAILLSLDRQKIENSPEVDTHMPVSRQRELEHFRYYGWDRYWGNPGMWALGPYGMAFPGGYPDRVPVAQPRERNEVMNRELDRAATEDSHLRSTQEVKGYTIRSKDDEFGHVEDFIIDDRTWAIRHLVIDTKNYWPSKSVLISPDWVVDVDWAVRRVKVDLSTEQIKNAPEYNPLAPVNREYEERLYDYYGRPKYWASSDTEAKAEEPSKIIKGKVI